MEQQLPADRRLTPRFLAKEGVLVLNSHILGPLINISQGGMAFECYVNDLPPAADQHLRDIGIFASSADLLITGLQCHTVHQTMIPQPSSLLPLLRVRCSIAFVGLQPAQQRLLARFLQNETTGPA